MNDKTSFVNNQKYGDPDEVPHPSEYKSIESQHQETNQSPKKQFVPPAKINEGKTPYSVPSEHVPSEAKKTNLRLKEILFMTIMQSIMIVLYATCCTYGSEVSGSGTTTATNTITNYYPMFQDVHVMIFIGFGFLMTFLKYHGWSSVMFNMLISAWSLEWGILCVSFFHSVFEDHWSTVELDITYLVEGDFAAAAVLISFGAVLGKINSFQLLVMATIEVIFYAFNVGLGQKE